jgi:hypothetical protein
MENDVWVFYTDDSDFAFTVDANSSVVAYDMAHDYYGPQVENMMYQTYQFCPLRVKNILRDVGLTV